MGGLSLSTNPSTASMKSFAFLAALVAVASARSVQLKDIEYGICPGSNDPLDLNTLSIEPYPIVVATGAEINLQLLITLNEPVPEGATVSLKIVKKGVIDLPIPCLEIEGIHLGSCDYTGQEILDVAADFLCPDYVPDGQTCTLPLNPGVYGGSEPLNIVLPTLPDAIVDLLASGTYSLTAKVNLADGSEMTCIFVNLELTGGK